MENDQRSPVVFPERSQCGAIKKIVEQQMGLNFYPVSTFFKNYFFKLYVKPTDPNQEVKSSFCRKVLRLQNVFVKESLMHYTFREHFEAWAVNWLSESEADKEETKIIKRYVKNLLQVKETPIKDTQFAELFAKHATVSFCFDSETEHWYLYTGRQWEACTVEVLKRRWFIFKKIITP